MVDLKKQIAGNQNTILILAIVVIAVFFYLRNTTGNTPNGTLCSAAQRSATVCTQELHYVCGSDGITYSNVCMACSDKAATFTYKDNACVSILNN